MTLTYDNYLEHYGVKGMKWGVRNDEAVLKRISRSQNTTYNPTLSKAERKAEEKQGKARYKEYKKNTTRKERKQDRATATVERGKYLIDESVKNPKGVVSTSMMAPNGTLRRTTMTGERFVSHLQSGAAVDFRNTQLTLLEIQKK